MPQPVCHTLPAGTPPVSPLLLSDHLITLAEQAGRAGYATTARRLVALARKVLEEPPRQTMIVTGADLSASDEGASAAAPSGSVHRGGHA